MTEALTVDRGQLVPGRQRDDQIAMKMRQRARGHDQSAIRERAKAATARSISPASRTLIGAHLHPERRRHGLDRGKLADPGGYGGITNDGRSRHTRRDLFEQLQPFPAQAVFERDESR